jgi:hypothetical protein
MVNPENNLTTEPETDYTPRKCKQDRYLMIGCTKGQVIMLDLLEVNREEVVDGELITTVPKCEVIYGRQ